MPGVKKTNKKTKQNCTYCDIGSSVIRCIAACFQTKEEKMCAWSTKPIRHLTFNMLARYNWGQTERTPQRGAVRLSLCFCFFIIIIIFHMIP